MSKAQLNPKQLMSSFFRKHHVSMSMAGGILEKKPAPQQPPPSAEEVDEVIRKHKENKRRAELGELKWSLDKPFPELVFLAPKPEPKKNKLLVFRGGTIHRSVFDMFKYYSGRKGHENVRV